MRVRVGVAVLLLVASSAACGGKPDGCVPLDPAVAQAVVNGATGDLQVRSGTGQAIRADSGVYYAAFRVAIAGDESVGVWALSDINPPGEIRSADSIAAEFTKWPALDGAVGSDRVRDAKACLD